MNIYLDKPDKTVQQIISSCFPNYTGRKIQISDKVPTHYDSYWCGGSRSCFAFYHLDQQQSFDLHSNHPAFEPNQPRDLGQLPARCVVVEHIIFCGKDLGIRIFANKSDLVPFLPIKADISTDERIVLKFTSGLKSSYAGIKDYRFYEAERETKITSERWEIAKNTLKTKKLLNKAGAITPSGRNALNS